MRRRRRRRVMLVGGLVGFGVYKMSQSNADRIQQETGIPPEEMTDQELEAAMDRLGIEKQYRDENDAETGAGSTGSSTGDLDELERLAALRDQGVLTDEEFTAKKRQILGL